MKQDIIRETIEKRIILGCLARNRSCQSELYTLFAPKMMRLCFRYAKNKEDAEEILQEGFIIVFKSIHQFNNEGSFEGWIKKIMINCSLRKYRSQVKISPVISINNNVDNIDVEGHEDVIDALTVKELLELVQKLPTASRIVFNLFVFEGFKHREIAKLLKISEGTSKSNLSDARTLLKKHIRHIYKIIHQENRG